MDTKGGYGRGPNGNHTGMPWSALGIGKTTDKQAIHAAYAAKRAELDSETMRISAFAELTEAREKALFLASEIERELARKETAPSTLDNQPIRTLDPPSIERNLPPEPEWQHSGKYEPNFDAPPIVPEPPISLDPNPDEEWSHAGGYVTDAQREWTAQKPDLNGEPNAAPKDWGNEAAAKIGREFQTFFQRYPFKKYGFFYVAAAFLLLSFCSS